MAGIKKSGAGLNSAQDLSQLVTSVNTALAVLGSSNKPIYPRIAFVDDGSQTEGKLKGEVISTFTNGDGSPGEVLKMAFSPVSTSFTEWSFGKDRQEVNETMCYIEIKRTRHSMPDTLLYWDTQDVYGILSGKIPAIMDRAGMLYDYLLAGAINDNPVSYDGKHVDGTDIHFFDTAHWIDPNDHSKGTYSNDITIAAADADGLGTALDAFAGIPWFDGKARGSGSDKPILLTPTKSLELKFRQLIHDGIIPTATSTVHVGATSPFDGMVESVELFQALRTERPQANASKYIYLLHKGSPVKAGLIVAPKRHPEFHISGLDAAEEIRRKKGAVSYGVDDFSGAGVGLPQDVIRVKVG